MLFLLLAARTNMVLKPIPMPVEWMKKKNTHEHTGIHGALATVSLPIQFFSSFVRWLLFKYEQPNEEKKSKK